MLPLISLPQYRCVLIYELARRQEAARSFNRRQGAAPRNLSKVILARERRLCVNALGLGGVNYPFGRLEVTFTEVVQGGASLLLSIKETKGLIRGL